MRKIYFILNLSLIIFFITFQIWSVSKVISIEEEVENSPCIMVIDTEDNPDGFRKSIIGYVKDINDNTLSTEYSSCISIHTIGEAIDKNMNLPKKLKRTIYNEGMKVSELDKKFDDGEDTTIIKDAFYLDAECKELEQMLSHKDTSIDLTFDINIPAHNSFNVYTYAENKWTLADKVINNNKNDTIKDDGTITVTFSKLGPVVITTTNM